MRIGLATLYTPEIAEFGRVTFEQKADYCAIHGYGFLGAIERLGDSARPPSWDKIPLLLRHLHDFDWIFWTDADAVIMNFAHRLEEYIDESSDIIITQDCNGINAGNYLVKSSRRMRKFLEAVYSETQFIDHPWWDQASMSHTIQQMPEIQVKYIPQNAINSYPGEYKVGEFMQHFAGVTQRAGLVLSACESSNIQIGTREDLPALLKMLGLNQRGAEVGVYLGDFAAIIARDWPGQQLHLIDHWRDDPTHVDITNSAEHEQEGRFKSTVERFAADKRVHVLREDSTKAASGFQDGYFDWIYIDANHRYEAIARDLRTWYPKVRVGGILAGHDFLDGDRSEGKFGVKRAVTEFATQKKVCVRVSKEEYWPTWYFVRRT